MRLLRRVRKQPVFRVGWAASRQAWALQQSWAVIYMTQVVCLLEHTSPPHLPVVWGVHDDREWGLH